MANFEPSRTLLVARATQTAAPNGISGMLSTAIPTGLLGLAFLTVFILLRVKQKRVYMPRTYLGSLDENQRTPKVSDTKFGWVGDFFRIKDEFALSHHSLDAYLLLRFFRLIVTFCLLAWPLTWVVLMSVYGTAHGGEQQFDKISYSNIRSTTDSNRLYATVFISWIVFGGAMWLIGRELVQAVQLRQSHALLPAIASRLSSRTVLFTNVPEEYLDEAKLREAIPSVKHVWISTKTDDLGDLVKDRNKTAIKLEGGEVKLIRTANNNRLDAEKKAAKKGETVEANEDPMHWINEKKERPTHRMHLFGLIGKKVDTIDWTREHLQEILPKIEEQQSTHWNGKAQFNSAVFIEFATVQAAEAAYFKTNIKVPKGFAPREIACSPNQIVWSNMNMSTSQRKIRNYVACALIFAMIIFFVPITVFVGALTNINSLTNKVKFLSFINHIPKVILGVVTGLLPTIVLAVCLALVPIIMRLLFKHSGAISLSEIELKTQKWYFIFQVIQVFLIVTITSSASSVVTQIIENPGSAPNLLATDLPKASNFYINYFVLYGLIFAAKALSNIAGVAVYIILGKFLDKTPRKIFKRYTKLSGYSWGSFYPVYTNLGVIALVYSCIAPLELGFACLSFFFVYVAFRYQVFFSVDTLAINMHGRSFMRAVKQLTTGVYLGLVCLIGLFAISTSASRNAVGPLVLEVIFLVFVVVYHVLLNRVVDAMDKNVSRMDSPSSMPALTMDANTHDEKTIEEGGRNDSTVSTVVADKPTGKAEAAALKVTNKLQNIYMKILRPSPPPAFDPWLSTAGPEYDSEVKREAYIDPAIVSPSPLLWIPKDTMGLAEREMEATSKIIGITDAGAWLDEKNGKVKVLWQDQPEDIATVKAQEAPIYEKAVRY